MTWVRFSFRKKSKRAGLPHTGIKSNGALERELTNLETLWLNDNQISDLSPLEKLTGIIYVWLSGNTHKTPAAKARLRQRLPNAAINFDPLP